MPSAFVDWSIIGLILISLALLVIETVDSIGSAYPALFRAADMAILVVFALEYVLRLWSCVEEPRYSAPLRGRLRFARRPVMLVDLIVILPLVLPMLGGELVTLRLLRMLRFLRLAKLGRYSTAMQTLGRVIASKGPDLAALFTVLVMLLIVASTLMYFAEHDAQPDAFSSIPAAMWWAVATLTTVGYGDVYPVTPLGRLLGSVIAILGIGFIALPTGLLSAGYVDEIARQRAQPPD